MPTEPESSPTISIEEHHTYDVDLGSQTELRWAEGHGRIRITLPYNSKQLHDGIGTDDATLHTIMLVPPESDTSSTEFSITVPTGKRALPYLKSGSVAVWHTTYAVTSPTDLLIDIQGHVFDGAGHDQATLIDLLFDRPEAFVNDLYLRLTCWAPYLTSPFRLEHEQELRNLLLQQENVRQVLLAGIEDIALLARSMVALANSEGGRILIGVSPRTQIVGLLRHRTPTERQTALETALLQAALRCDPPMLFSPPDELYHPDGPVVRVLVPKSGGVIYRVDGLAYRRDGSVTVTMASVPSSPSIDEQMPAIGDLKGILMAGSNDDVIVLDGSGGLDTLELGPLICSLINADRQDGLIIIRNLVPHTRASFFDILRRSSGSILEQAEQRIDREVKCIMPRLDAPRPVLSRSDDAIDVVIRVPRTPARVALYNNQGYAWSARALQPLTMHDIFTRYIQRAGTGPIQRGQNGSIHVSYAELNWPIRPPNTPWANTQITAEAHDLSTYDSHYQMAAEGEKLSTYDGQRQAMVWRNRPFKLPPKERGAMAQGDRGLRCSLITPLRHVLMRLEQQSVTMSNSTLLQGSIYIQFDDLLASGIGLQVTGADEPSFLANAPIVKTTYVRLRLTIDADWLFRRRRRTSFLGFRLPDLNLDDEQIAAIRQVCADLGFRMDKQQDTSRHHVAVLQGLRNKGFYDISLLIGIRHEPAVITRELHYEQRTDNKQTASGMLDIRIALSGIGDEAASEITQLHLQLQQLISRRLQYLRVD